MEVEPPPLEERRRLQEELSEFVESCCRTLEEVTASLGWSLDQLDPGDEAAAEVRRRWPGLLGSEGFSPKGRRAFGPGLSERSTPVRCRGGQGSWGARLWGAACGLGELLCHLSKGFRIALRVSVRKAGGGRGVGVEFSFLYLKSGRLSVPVL